MCGGQEVDGLVVLVDGALEILPLALDLDVRLVHSPTLALWTFLAFPKGCLQLWREFLDPAVNVGMVNFDAALFHHFLQVPVAERISQIPTHTEQDNLFFEAVSFEVDHVGNLIGVC
jgi:hypothetical protein